MHSAKGIAIMLRWQAKGTRCEPFHRKYETNIKDCKIYVFLGGNPIERNGTYS